LISLIKMLVSKVAVLSQLNVGRKSDSKQVRNLKERLSMARFSTIDQLGREGVQMFGLLGVTGSGKTTKGKIIVKLLETEGVANAVLIGMESILGDSVRTQVDDVFLITRLEERLRREFDLGNRMWFIEGIPHNKDQAKAFGALHKVPFRGIHFRVPPNVALERLKLSSKQVSIGSQSPSHTDRMPIPVDQEQQKILETIGSLTRSNPKIVEHVDGADRIQPQVMKALRTLRLDKNTFRKLADCLNNPKHPATKIMIEAENQRKAKDVPIIHLTNAEIAWAHFRNKVSGQQTIHPQ
jgi:hypothetical protein